MQIEVFTIADAATEFGGKLNLLGSFDTLNVEKLPGVLPSFTIALKIRATTSEKHTQNFEIEILDPEGNNLIEKFVSSVNFKFIDSIDTATAHILINLQGVPFPKFGKYVVKLTHEGLEKASLPLYVRSIV